MSSKWRRWEIESNDMKREWSWWPISACCCNQHKAEGPFMQDQGGTWMATCSELGMLTMNNIADMIGTWNSVMSPWCNGYVLVACALAHDVFVAWHEPKVFLSSHPTAFVRSQPSGGWAHFILRTVLCVRFYHIPLLLDLEGHWVMVEAQGSEGNVV